MPDDDVPAAEEFRAPARLWHALPDGRIQCDVCPHYCRLDDGERGRCLARARVGDRIVLSSYGQVCGVAAEPVEAMPLYHFLPGTPVLAFGTTGCNLSCRFCQSWDVDAVQDTRLRTQHAPPQALAETARARRCRSVAFTDNDPTVFLEYAVDVADACHELGVRTVAVSAGYLSPAAAKDLYSHMDAAVVDLKSLSESFYTDVVGGHLEPVLDTLRYLRHETDVWLEITTVVIPGLNDTRSEVEALTTWITDELGPDVPLHLMPFRPTPRMPNVPPTPPELLTAVRRIARAEGLHHVYTGNVHDPECETTFCPRCGTGVIERFGDRIEAYRLDAQGRCSGCGTALPGRFGTAAGRWGGRRLPVRVDTG